MRMDKLTSKFQMALADAQSLALGRDHQFIEPIHMMTALLDQQGGVMRQLLGKSGVNVNLLFGTASVGMPIPCNYRAIGFPLHVQFASLSPGTAPCLGIPVSLSNRLGLIIGQ